ncbi:MAG: hypothetical protein ACYTG5_21875 [Planctomycetota bacterium]|jgi:hypothetical protein
MRRIAWVPLTAAAAILLGYGAYRSFASDETKINWLIQDAAESFNATNLSGCLAIFAEDYQDSKVAELDLENLTQILRYTFFSFRDSESKAFRLRVLVPEERLVPQVTGDSAELAFALQLEERKGQAWEPSWEVQVDAKLIRTEDGWRVTSSRHETLSGARPR